MTRLPTAGAGPLHIRGPAELLQAVPYLLGFHPSASLVLVGLHEGALVVTARLDLPDAVDGDVPGPLVDGTLTALTRGGATAFVAIAYPADDDRVAWPTVAAGLERQVDRHGGVLSDALVVCDGRWWSALCAGGGCCPPGGEPLPVDTSPYAAAATVAGTVPLPDRAALEASLDPVPQGGQIPAAMIDAALAAMVSASPPGGAQRHRRGLVRELLALAGESDAAGWLGPTDATAARLVTALGEVAIRDEVWLAVEAGRIDGRPLWRDLARRAPGACRAPALFLFGWTSWRHGDGALAGIAADRAVRSDPAYSAADLLLAALSRGVDPRTMRRLHLPRSA